ncbi:MAG: VOC family protein [Alphaproteobacteria bacterium]|nr:VOC family protein [Alphaproteobacteria bacterium]
MAVVPVKGLFEAHLTVSDLDRSIAFYRDVVGLELAHRVPRRHAAFFWLGQPGHTMLGLWSIHSSPMRMRLHIAFDVSLDSVIASVDRLRAVGITPLHGRGDGPIDEPVVISWMPAASVYFDDPDGHSLEYISMLSGQPHPEWGWISLSEWNTRTA